MRHRIYVMNTAVDKLVIWQVDLEMLTSGVHNTVRPGCGHDGTLHAGIDAPVVGTNSARD